MPSTRTVATPTAREPAPAVASRDAARALGDRWLQHIDIGQVIRLETGETLYSQGARHDCFYLVRSGQVHTTVLRPDGSSLLLEIYGDGSIFGEASAFIDNARYVTATAATPVVLSRYHAGDMRTLCASHPDLVISLIQLLGIKHRLLIDKLASFTSATPEQRVLDLLGRLARSGRAGDSPLTALPRLTHAQIAASTGLSRVTVTRVLKPLAERGLISTRSHGVEIIDAPALIALLELAG
ncbi:MAG: Crp/Fnr family transcriptional regulator [Comamonadaceae bacterium]|nr:MAG: Crp/Fnr family transcriptional regulator [Comamonadaceae bacterium]